MKINISKSFENLCILFILFSPLLFKNALLIFFVSLVLLVFGLANLFNSNKVNFKS